MNTSLLQPDASPSTTGNKTPAIPANVSPEVITKETTLPTRSWPFGVTESIDPDGKTVLLVPVFRGKQPARFFPEDYQQLLRQGYGHYWWLPNAKSPQVRVGGRMQARTVKRLIVNAKEGEKVFRLDTDPLNLRRDNLRVVAAKTRTERTRKSEPTLFFDWYTTPEATNPSEHEGQ